MAARSDRVRPGNGGSQGGGDAGSATYRMGLKGHARGVMYMSLMHQI